MSNRMHVDDATSIKFRLIQEWDSSLKKRINKVKEFNHHIFSAKYSSHFKTRPFFNVTQEEIEYAGRAIDRWILEEYKNEPEILEKYEKHNTMPERLRTMEDIKRYAPVMLLPFFEIFTKANQNKWCNYQVLEKPIPGFPDLTMNVFSGFKIQGPFACDQKNYYVILTINGKTKDIDSFMAPFRI